MKNKLFLIVVLGVFLMNSFAQNTTENNNNLTTLKGEYLGQAPPDLTPEVFAPGILSTRYHEHSTPNFSPDGKMLIYTLSCEHGHTLMYMQFVNGQWTLPKALPFSGQYSDDSHVWSPDANKLYFTSKRPVENDTIKNIYRNWVVELNDTGWSEPEENHFSAYSFTSSGTNYFHVNNDETNWDIYRTEPPYESHVKLGSNVNTSGVDATPFIAADESYLIFASMGRDDAVGIMDLYISFRKHDDSWTKAINMGEPINTPGHISRFPRVSPDGKYLFYWSNLKNDNEYDPLSEIEKQLVQYKPWRPDNGKDGDMYWVDAKVIEQLKLKVEE